MPRKKVAVEWLAYTQAELESLWKAKAVAQMRVESMGADFAVTADLISGVKVEMVNVRQGISRRFLNPAAALMTLRRMGVTRVEVRMEKWDLDLASLSMRMRPDVTARRLREKRVREKSYFPDRDPEPAVADRKDQLQKLMATIMEMARHRALTH